MPEIVAVLLPNLFFTYRNRFTPGRSKGIRNRCISPTLSIVLYIDHLETIFTLTMSMSSELDLVRRKARRITFAAKAACFRLDAFFESSKLNSAIFRM